MGELHVNNRRDWYYDSSSSFSFGRIVSKAMSSSAVP